MTFDEINVAIANVPLPLAAKMIAMMNSGASEDSGASHCTSRNRSMPNMRAGVDQAFGERFCTGHDHHGGEDEQRRHRDAAGPVGKRSQRRGGADQFGFLDLAAAQLVKVVAEPAQQYHAEDDVDAAGRGYQEGGHPGEHQEADLHPVADVEIQFADFAAGGLCVPPAR